MVKEREVCKEEIKKEKWNEMKRENGESQREHEEREN